MPTEKKAETVEELVKLLGPAKVAVLTDYRGLKVSEISQLRRKLRAAGIEFHVTKNTLTRLAAEKVGKGEIGTALKGPTAIAFGYKDEVEPAKMLVDYIRTSRSILKIKGALLGNRLLAAETVAELALLPSRQVLLARVVGQMQAPIQGLMTVLNGNLRGLVTVLQGRAKQLEEEASAA
ncbi:MAG: 50S ribosomal protein L10 [Dehalococcoidia bacterium]|nr:50S ribosomal protein L10 [Dehalococcoidia bacterium]